MKGQIKYTYVFGMFAFIVGLLFGSEIIVRILPTYASAIRRKNLDLVADSVITLLSKDPGCWKNKTSNGSDWEKSTHLNYTWRIGFEENNTLDEKKINASSNFTYAQLKEKLGLTQRNIFVKIVYETVSENCTINKWEGFVNGERIICCSLPEVKCVGIRPVGKMDLGVREEMVLAKTGSKIINGKLRVIVW